MHSKDYDTLTSSFYSDCLEDEILNRREIGISSGRDLLRENIKLFLSVEKLKNIVWKNNSRKDLNLLY